MNDPHHLQRFVDAQDPVYGQVVAELRSGRKTSHWMWFIFPQIAGLGRSPTAMRFAITSKDEALAYLDHPVLGPRLRECTRLVNLVQGSSLAEIFGFPDDHKFRSCMTLFAQVAEDNEEFLAALAKYCGGEEDPATLGKLLARP
jgi:uncharacterized protein (DUF1810 family)